jgi:hypothetical protein
MTTPFPFVAGQVLTAAQLNDIQNLPISDKTASYVLIAGDETKRTIMNSASATTITVNNSIFTVGDVIQVANKGAGTCTITAGAGVTINTSGSLALAQYGGGYLLALSASTFTFFNLGGGGSVYGTATGGIGSPTAVTIGGVNYEYLTFNSTGTLTVTKAGFFDFCAIGGGGGATNVGIAGYAGGGGGAGQVSIASVYLDTNQTVTIGAGGAFYAYTTFFTKAGDTTVGATAPFIIGAAGNNANTSQAIISLGYIGGGVGSADSKTSAAITENTLIGYRGGNSDAITNAGGGGGRSARGGNASGTQGGTGGAGFDVAGFIGGSATFKAQGGGGGGSVTGGTAATNGVAGSATTTPPNGGANTGQGGGGGFGTITTGNGGSGIVYIRYKV